MNIRYEKAAVKALARMPRKVAQTMAAKIALFAAKGKKAHVDIDTLKGVENGYRLRQGDWRALMYITDDTLIVTAIKPRGDAYK